MQKRTVKQITIGLIYLAILAAIGFLVFVIVYEKPTCFDDIQNQGETAVDCGGPCPACEFETIKELDVQWVKFFETESNVYDLAALADNPNPNYGSENLVYEFTLYNTTNRVIARKQGKTFVLPNQKKYFIEPRVKTLEKVSRVEITFKEIEWQKLENFEGAGLFIRNKKFESNGSALGKAQAKGVVKNTSPYDWGQILVKVILFSEKREIMGVGSTEIYSLLSGEEREFTVTWFNELPGAVFDTEMVAETNIFADENFMRNYQGGEQFQEFE